MSVLQHPALTRLWYGGQPAPNAPNQQHQTPNPVYPNSNHIIAASSDALGLQHHVPERSHSPHSVDGSTVRTRRKNRERRGTENSLPVTFDAVEILGDIGEEFRKESDKTLSRKDNFIGAETKRGQTKMDTKTDYQVPFPQVQDMTAANTGSKPRRAGVPQPINSNEQRDWEREQALRSPTLSAHSNTSSSHTTAPTSVSTGNTTANSSAGASALTIPGSYETGSASGGSGVEVTPTRETVSKSKRASGGTTAATTNGATANNNSSAAPAVFYNQQLAQHLPSAPSPSITLQQQGYRASPPPLPATGSPQARAAPGGSSPSQPPRAAYAPPPPTMASTAPGSSNGSIDSYEVAPTLTTRSSFMTNATINSLPTLPDSPPSPEPANLADILRSPPFVQQQLAQHGVQTGLSGMASMLQAQQVPISPLHPRPTNRTQAAGVLGPTKMAESWTAAPPPEELDDEVRERMVHLGGARDGATVRHRPGGSVDLKDTSSWQAQAPERQGSVRRPKPASQTSTASVPPIQTQPQQAPAMTRNPTMPMARYETMSPPPIRDTHGGLHLDLHDNKSLPDNKPQPAPARSVPGPGRGPSPSPSGPRGRETTRAPGATPPYSHDDQALYGRGRSSSHNTYNSQPVKAPVPPPPAPPQNQWGARAPGGIVPFNEDLDHDEHEQQPGPPVMQQQQPPMLQSGKSEQSIVDWANHTQSQHPLTHPNQPQPVPPGLSPIAAAPVAAPSGERRGRSRSRGRGDQNQAQAPLMDPASMYQQQSQQSQQSQQRSPEVNGGGASRASGGRSPVPAPAPVANRGGAGSGSSEAEDLKTPRSPSVPLPNDGYPRFGYGQFSVGHPGTINHIYTQDLGQNGQMYPSMGFAQSQYALQQMGAGPQGMMGGGYHMNGQNGRQVNGRDNYSQGSQNGYYGYPQDLSSSASGSFLDGWTSNQFDGRGYPTQPRPSAPVPPTPSSATAPTSVSGEIRHGTQGQIARAQSVLYNAQSQLHPQQAYPPYNYAQAQMSYAMDPYRAPSVVSSFMASPFSHNPFLPPVPEPQSTQSSPSHQPVGLPYVPGPTAKKFGGARMGTKSMGRRRRMMEEFRPESTVPNDTASEAETEGKRARDDGTETEFETETEMEEVWLEESDDDELDSEFHPTYFMNPAKRKRR
ncbi:hypothetical protein FRC07_003820, partial [Ceratobasidium sp. 392]